VDDDAGGVLHYRHVFDHRGDPHAHARHVLCRHAVLLLRLTARNSPDAPPSGSARVTDSETNPWKPPQPATRHTAASISTCT